MLQFKITDSEAYLVLTLNELATLPEPFYLFVFTHVLTKDVVSFIKATADDFSNYPERFNKFLINPNNLFIGKDVGEWHYKIYEQDNGQNTNVNNTVGVVEYGKLILLRNTEFAFKMYNAPVKFKTYNG